MPRTIRVFPGGAAGLGGAGGFGGAGAWNQSWGIGGHPAAEMARSTVDHTKDLARTQLDYERQLVDARVQRAQTETVMKYLPNAVGLQNPYGINPMVAPGGFGIPGGVPIGGLGGFGGYGGYGAVGGANIAAMPGLVAASLGARGQVNSTNQSSAGSATQTVTNANTLHANHYNMHGLQHSPYASTGVPGWGLGLGHGGFGTGGFLGGLGGLIGRLF